MMHNFVGWQAQVLGLYASTVQSLELHVTVSLQCVDTSALLAGAEQDGVVLLQQCVHRQPQPLGGTA